MSESSQRGQDPKFCIQCKEMFGNPIFKDMCSKCYKSSLEEVEKNVDMMLKKKNTSESAPKLSEPSLEKLKLEKIQRPEKGLKKDNEVLPQAKQQQIQKPTEKNGKCSVCNKKVGLLGYSCSHCTQMYCKFHRLPEDHECKADFISLGRKKLKLENPLLETSKIEKI